MKQDSEISELILDRLFDAFDNSTKDRTTREISSRMRSSIEELFGKIKENVPRLERVNKTLRTGFGNTDYVQTTLNDHEKPNIFANIHAFVDGEISKRINSYLAMSQEFSLYFSDNDKVEGAEKDESVAKNKREGLDAIKSLELMKDSFETFCQSMDVLPKMTKAVQRAFLSYNELLVSKFIKSDKDKGEDMMEQMLRLMNGDKPIIKTKYNKIKLIDGNPVLTDMLLSMADEIPQYRDSPSGKGKTGRKSKQRFVSDFEINNAAENLSAFSDTKMISYLEDSPRFTRYVGLTLNEFYGVMKELHPLYEKLFNSQHFRAVVQDEKVFSILSGDHTKDVERIIKKIARVNLDAIVQDKDDVLPDSKREKDFFDVREKLLNGIYESMKTLSRFENVGEREEAAKEIIKKLVESKTEMIDLSASELKRKLRQDKTLDNEFYVGRQKEAGRFYFERKPVPDAKIDDVIGESFDEAKLHIGQIIETSKTPRLVRMTAPGGKVKSNILLIGPYGCGKTELARAVCADKRVIGASVSVANSLTAYMHESVANVKRIYDSAAELWNEARGSKPVTLILDEFDGWFARSERGNSTDTDMQQIEDVFLEVLDGMEDYSGIVTVAMTNKPMAIPKGIMRRFRYVDIVGKLNQDERKKILSMYLEKRLPVSSGIENHYDEWAQKLEHAPGDVIRKVVDELHFDVVPQFIRKYSKEAERLERILYNRERNTGALNDKDIKYVKSKLMSYGVELTPEQVGRAVDDLLLRPNIQQQINAAKQVYEEADAILEQLKETGPKFGFRRQTSWMDVH